MLLYKHCGWMDCITLHQRFRTFHLRNYCKNCDYSFFAIIAFLVIFTVAIVAFVADVTYIVFVPKIAILQQLHSCGITIGIAVSSESTNKNRGFIFSVFERKILKKQYRTVKWVIVLQKKTYHLVHGKNKNRFFHKTGIFICERMTSNTSFES